MIKSALRRIKRMFGNPHKSLGTAVKKTAAGDMRSALRIVDELIANDPYFLDARKQRAEWLLAAGRHAEAAEDIKVQLQLFPRNDAALALLGDCFLQMHDYAAASEHYMKALEVNRKNKRALNGLLLLADMG
jgi:tetratricopeptide (TPR) repeat protein